MKKKQAIIIATYQSDNDLLDVWFSEFISGNRYYTIMFNCSLIHTVKSKYWHEKKLNQLIEKYDLKKVYQD